MGVLDSYRRTLGILSASAAVGWGGTLRADLAPLSPFLPPNSAVAGAQAGPSGPVELRGIMSSSQGAAYCIYDTAKRTSAWVGLNEGGNDFVVKSADPGSDSVTVQYQGRSLRLVLRTAKISSSGSGSGGGGPPGAPSALASSVVLNPTPADEQRRLEAVAQEVRRRRMERERAAQAAQDGGQGQGGAAPPVPNR
jgi:hypothetical protein